MCQCIKLLLAAVLIGSAASAFAADNATQLTLERAVAIALDQNPEFKTAGLGIQAAEHRRRAAGADFLPKVGTSYSYTRFNEPPRLKMPAGDLSPQDINVVVGTQNMYQWGLHLVQPLFTGGALYNKYKLEKLGVDVARLNNDTARNELIYNVKAAYFTVLKAQKLLDVARQAVEQIASHEKTTHDFYEQEMIAKNDLLEAQVRLAEPREARALLDGRFAPSVDDVLDLAEPVLKHRMALTFAARAEGETIPNVIRRLKARIG